jgi:hypothetical protein
VEEALNDKTLSTNTRKLRRKEVVEDILNENPTE